MQSIGSSCEFTKRVKLAKLNSRQHFFDNCIDFYLNTHLWKITTVRAVVGVRIQIRLISLVEQRSSGIYRLLMKMHAE